MIIRTNCAYYIRNTKAKKEKRKKEKKEKQTENVKQKILVH